MNSRERVARTLQFREVDRAPRDLWTLAGVRMFRKSEVDALLQRYPIDFKTPSFTYGKSKRAKGCNGDLGAWTDVFGCEWVAAEPGVSGEVKHSPLADAGLAEIERYEFPYEILDDATWSSVNTSCAATTSFVRAVTYVRPFERMQHLLGTERLYMEMAYDSQEFHVLLERLNEFFLREVELWTRTDVDGMVFLDDWGGQNSLLISPEMWRSIFKPLYRRYFALAHQAGKRVFFHSDGHILPIIEDLIEVGVDALNSQLFCQNIEELGARFAGRITFWGEIDRQRILPFGTVDDVREAVHRVRRALDTGNGGVIAQCEWGNKDPAENIAAVFETWMEQHPLHVAEQASL